MSGGSFNYLCWADSDEIMFDRYDDLLKMVDALLDCAPSSKAYIETLELKELIRQIRQELDKRLKRLSPVWHAVEWRRSGDYADDDLEKAIAKFEGSTSCE